MLKPASYWRTPRKVHTPTEIQLNAPERADCLLAAWLTKRGPSRESYSFGWIEQGS